MFTNTANPSPAALSLDHAGNVTAAWVDASQSLNVAQLGNGAAAWSTPVALPTPVVYSQVNGPETNFLYTGSDQAGDTTVLWESALGNELLASTKAAGSANWSTPVVSSQTGGQILNTAVGQDGTFYVFYSDSSSNLKTTSYATATQSWSTTASVVMPTTKGLLLQGAIAVNPQGGLVATFTQELPNVPAPNLSPPYGLFASTASSVAGPWSSPVELDVQSSPVGEAVSYPNLIEDEQGNATVLWESQKQDLSGNNDLYASRLSDGASIWTMPVQLDTTALSRGAYTGYPTPMAADASGNLMAIWTAISGTTGNPIGVFSTMFTAATQTWGATVEVAATPNSTPTGIDAVFVDKTTGEFAGIYSICQTNCQQIPLEGGDLFSSVYDGGAWATPKQVDAPVAAGQVVSFPAAVSTGNGTAVALWGSGTSGTAVSPKQLYANVLK